MSVPSQAAPREALDRAAELAARMRAEIRKVLVGQEQVVDQTLCALFAADTC